MKTEYGAIGCMQAASAQAFSQDLMMASRQGRQSQLLAALLNGHQRAFWIPGSTLDVYQNTYTAPPAITLVVDLDRWFEKLQRRIAELEADDNAMGRSESDRWAKELFQFREELGTK